jgi:cytochrome c oxidase subunit 2
MLYTLAELPYPAMAAASQAAPESVRVTGRMWHWEIDKTRVAAGSPVDFQVTSADVNHGFGIYDPDMRLVGQTQAMPGYVNTLRLTFRRPGTYRVLCLEYCGVAHHAMASELTVVEAPETGGPT